MSVGTIRRVIVPMVPGYNTGSKVCGFAPLTSHVHWRDMMGNSDSKPNWTDAEIVFLRERWQTMTHAQMAAALGRTVNAVRSRCHLSGFVRQHAWTDGELDRLREFYADAGQRRSMGLDAFSASLGRDKANVCRKARSLGLTNVHRSDGRRDRRKFKGDVEAMRAHLSKVRREWLRTHEHPRGALGMKHSPETLEKLSIASKRAAARMTAEDWAERGRKGTMTKLERYGTTAPLHLQESAGYSRGAGGRRTDLDNRYFRSMWEANYARYLNWLIDQGEIRGWEYEADTFVFHGVTRGAITYRPDFKVTERDGSVVYHEVKGWMDGPSKTRLKRMKKFYPEVTVIVIGEDEYRAIAKWRDLIPNWEKGKRG